MVDAHPNLCEFSAFICDLEDLRSFLTKKKYLETRQTIVIFSRIVIFVTDGDLITTIFENYKKKNDVARFVTKSCDLFFENVTSESF